MVVMSCVYTSYIFSRVGTVCCRTSPSESYSVLCLMLLRGASLLVERMRNMPGSLRDVPSVAVKTKYRRVGLVLGMTETERMLQVPLDTVNLTWRVGVMLIEMLYFRIFAARLSLGHQKERQDDKNKPNPERHACSIAGGDSEFRIVKTWAISSWTHFFPATGEPW